MITDSVTELAPVSELAVEESPVHRSAEDQVAELLRAEVSGSQSEGESPSTETASAPPETDWGLKAVAEKLGVDPSQLYSQLKVALDDGAERTVSELKDAFRSSSEIERAREELIGEVTAARQTVMDSEQTLGVLIRQFSDRFTAAEIQSAVETAARHREAQTAALLKALPEWSDPIRQAADMAGIRAAAKRVGISESELQVLQHGYSDHRWMVALRMIAQGSQTEPAGKKPAAALRPAPAAQSRGAVNVKQLRAAVRSGKLNPADAVSALLNSKGIR